MSLSLVDFHSVHVICLDHDPQRRVNCGECLFGLLGLGRPHPSLPPATYPVIPLPPSCYVRAGRWRMSNVDLTRAGHCCRKGDKAFVFSKPVMLLSRHSQEGEAGPLAMTLKALRKRL